MGLIYSSIKSDMNSYENRKISSDDDFVKIKKPELPIKFLNNYLTKQHLPIIYESSDENETDLMYDVDLLDSDEKNMLDSVFGI